MTHSAEKATTCCACTRSGIAFVIDGAHRKPVCEQHGRMYRQQGYRITGGPVRPTPCWRSECRNGCYYPDACSEKRGISPEAGQ